MRVAEYALQQQLLVLFHLRIGIQPAAGVIEVDLSGAVEAGIVRGTQFVQAEGGFVRWVF